MLKKLDIDDVSLLHAAIRALRKDRTARADKEAQDKFHSSVGQVIESLEADLEGQENILLREADSTHARFLLYDLCFAELVEHATANLDPELAAVLRRFRRSYQHLFAKLPAILHETFPPGAGRGKDAPEMAAEPYDELRNQAKAQPHRAQSSPTRAAAAQPHSPSRPNGILRPSPPPGASPEKPSEAPRVVGGYAWRHANLPREDSARTEAGNRWASGATASPGAQPPARVASAHTTPGGPAGRVEAGEEADEGGEGDAGEAEQAPDALAGRPLYPYPRPLLDPAPAPPPPRRVARSAGRSTARASRQGSKNRLRRSASQERPPAPDGDVRSSIQASEGSWNNRRREPSSEPPQVSARPLTQKQLAAFIEGVYASKEEFDVKCVRAGLPRETLEQHMFTYLNQKYGLKPLVLEYAAGIVTAARRYAPADNDVAVFHKALRNEIDEDFRHVQQSLKETLADLLRLHLLNKYPLKSEKELQAMLQSRLKGHIAESEWVEVVRGAYEGRDAEHVAAIVRRVQQNVADAAGEPPIRLPYPEFLKTCLEYQLRGHEAFLRPFVRLFRTVDGDRDGVVNDVEFRQLVRSLDPENPKPDPQIAELLRLADPCGNLQITFSESVATLSQELLAFSNRLQEQKARGRAQ